MSPWKLVYKGFDPQQQGLREALTTLGNGCFATRGALEEARADGTHYPGTYLAGGYNRLESVIAGRRVVNEDLVNFPNWLPLRFPPQHGPWFEPARLALRRRRHRWWQVAGRASGGRAPGAWPR